ncbi:MAG TPA: hypothetical protein PKD78_07645, partial [Saprospiraceae bacterium]|nr:hypothetical protein [Saprospiraceae bacterium]
MRQLLFPLYALLGLCLPAHAQVLPQPRIFSLADVRQEMCALRKASVEHIIVRGDHTPEGDRRMVQELEAFLQSPLGSADGRCSWKRFSNEVKHLTIQDADWSQLPEQLGRFDHLSDIVFINCPKLSLQVINDQIKTLPNKDFLGDKFRQEMISMTFQEVPWASADKSALDSNLFTDLRELRFIRIPNFHDCCSTLLPELQRCCPNLGWLTIEGCLLDNSLPLDTLRGFSQLKALSLRSNRLHRVPALPAKLRSLDISSNLISEFYEKRPDDPLRMLYMDCNLFSQLTMTDILARDLYPALEVLTFECNNMVSTELDSTVMRLDRGQVSSFMSYAPRYVNDFRPETVSCAECLAYRWQMMKSVIEPLSLLGGGGSGWALQFGGDGEKFKLAHADGRSTTYELLSIKTCTRGSNREWTFVLEVRDAANPEA